MRFTDRALTPMLLPNIRDQFSIWMCSQGTYYPTKNNCLSHSEALNTKEERTDNLRFQDQIKAVRFIGWGFLPTLFPDVSQLLNNF